MHEWKLTAEEAVMIQKELAAKCRYEDDFGNVETVAGIDSSYRGDLAGAAIVVMRYPDLEVLETVTARRPVEFPYISGFLSFRESPVVLDAWEKLSREPDLLIFDGQGRAHPRGLGIASHLGLLLDKPAIGCAKTRLCGDYEEPGLQKGDWSPLILKDVEVGSVLRSRDRVKPLFVSPGHRIGNESSRDFVLNCCRKYRLPETTRAADKLAGELTRK